LTLSNKLCFCKEKPKYVDEVGGSSQAVYLQASTIKAPYREVYRASDFAYTHTKQNTNLLRIQNIVNSNIPPMMFELHQLHTKHPAYERYTKKKGFVRAIAGYSTSEQ
jgi:hypothetical protein